MIKFFKHQIVLIRDYIKWHILKIQFFLLKLIDRQPIFEGKNTPIIINNFNRLTYLKDLIERLQYMGYDNLYIIDNNSSYEPLLKYYERTPCKVYRLKQNLGHLALWKSGLYKIFKNRFFVYTDSDILPNDDCPPNFLEDFYELMIKYKVSKVGFAIEFKDLPETYNLKKQVELAHNKLWANRLKADIYEAGIDTTFALHFPNLKVGFSYVGKNLRVGGKYICKHQPWYIDSNNLSEEEEIYMRTCNNSASWAQLQKQRRLH